MAETTRALLPKNVTPSKYNLILTPNFLPISPKVEGEESKEEPKMTFDGEESVSIHINEPSTTITIHSKEIEISSASVVIGDKTVNAKNTTFDTKSETVSFEFEEALPQGEATLNLKFQGILNDQMAGFYRSKYTLNGQPAWLATTQFEPTDARRAFPCWDEPSLKAKFSITLIVPKDLDALSNMPETSNEVVGDKRKVTFDETPVVSTYLIAYVVGKFDYVEGQSKEGIKVRVYTPVGKKVQGEFALGVATKILSYYTDYYGVGYPLPKSDMIAIPDFSAGAMENWGLITYRETALLIDPEQSSISQKQRVAYVVAHELAHMWFGNLVTMEWWKELWLNEGFATFVGNQAVDHLFPEWDIWTQFISQYFARALDLDGLKSSHPIEVEVENSAQINEIFDAISYCKGASANRMVCTYIGESNFRKGLNIYLNRHKYKNAVTTDLWAALSEASGLPVKDFMDNWTKVTGYPVLSISESSEEGSFDVSQQLFLSSGEKVEEKDNPTWWISARFLTSKNEEISTIDIKERKQTIKVPNSAGSDWIKVNAGQAGFYRVNYSAGLLAKLEKAISSNSLTTVDRLGVQNDAFALAKAGLLPTAQALSLARGYINETDYTVWSDVSKNLGDISRVWETEPCFDLLKNYKKKLFGPIATQIGWDKKEGEKELNSLLRSVVLGQFGGAGDEATIAEAKKRFNSYLDNPSSNSLPADLRSIVFSLAIKNGGDAEWEKLKNHYLTADMHEEKIRALSALTLMKTEEAVIRILKFGLTDAVRSQDIFYVFGNIASFALGRQTAWTFLKDNWAEFEKRFASGAFLLGRIVSYTISNFTTEEAAKDIEAFFAAHPCDPAKRSIEQGLESIRGNATWLARDKDGVAKWLQENQ